MRNDMNCFRFRIIIQRFFRLNRLLLLCLGFVVLACVFVQVFFSLVLSVFVWWVLRCLTGLCCLSLDFLVFTLFSSLSKQLLINSYMPFYYNIIGF